MASSGIERRLSAIEERNARVEAEKAWETSWARRSLIALFTYLSIALYFLFIGLPSPWLNAVVPTAGFLLSTLTLPFFRGAWLKGKNKCG